MNMIIPNPEHDLELDPKEPFRSSLEDGLILPDINAKWNVLSKECKSRKQKWITRYANRLNESDIRKANLSLLEERQARIEASGWRNVIVPKGDLQLPTVGNTASVDDLVPFEDQPYALRSGCCWRCWKVVPGDASRVECCSCPLIAHRHCVNPESLFVEKEVLVDKYLTYNIYSRQPTARNRSTSTSTPLPTGRRERAISAEEGAAETSSSPISSSPTSVNRKLINLLEKGINSEESSSLTGNDTQEGLSSSSTSVAVVLEGEKEVVYDMDFKPVATEDMPSEELRAAMRTLDDDTNNPTSMNLDSLIFTEFSPQSEKDLRFRIFKTFLYKLKPSVKSLSLRFNLILRDWQEYLIEWVDQNEWLEELHILGTAFDGSMRRMLAEAWKSHLSSHLLEDNGNTLLRTDVIELRVKASNMYKVPCPFCLDDLGAYNSWMNGHNSIRLLRYKRLACVVTLQAFFRMLTARLRYKRGRKVILSLQRKYRAAVFWKKSFAAKIIELRPFRLRIHRLNFIVHLSEQLAKKEKEKEIELEAKRVAKDAKKAIKETKSGGSATMSDNLVQVRDRKDVRRKEVSAEDLAYQIGLLAPPNLKHHLDLGSIPAAMYHHLNDDANQISADITKALQVVKGITSGTNFAMLDRFEDMISHDGDIDRDSEIKDTDENRKNTVGMDVIKSVLKDGYSSRPNYISNPKLSAAMIFNKVYISMCFILYSIFITQTNSS